MIPIDLSGKTALVTGAGGELGRVIALTLAKAGANVAAHYHRSRERAEAVAAQARELGRKACAVQADITVPGEVQAMARAVRGELGAPHILVNNAVSQYPWKPVLEQDAADYEAQFRSSVLQNVLMAQVFAPEMVAARWGRIIAISTECVMQNHPRQSAYVSGKRGMDGVLRVLAREIGEHGVTVNQVAPGWTISERDRIAGTERREDYEKNVPLRRRGHDWEIANAVAFLASDLAGFITGVFLPVCGGNVMPAV